MFSHVRMLFIRGSIHWQRESMNNIGLTFWLNFLWFFKQSKDTRKEIFRNLRNRHQRSTQEESQMASNLRHPLISRLFPINNLYRLIGRMQNKWYLRLATAVAVALAVGRYQRIDVESGRFLASGTTLATIRSLCFIDGPIGIKRVAIFVWFVALLNDSSEFQSMTKALLM